MRRFDYEDAGESGTVLFPENAPLLPEFLRECLSFPGGKNDDQVDALHLDFHAFVRRDLRFSLANYRCLAIVCTIFRFKTEWLGPGATPRAEVPDWAVTASLARTV
jgi:hypothetical protein